MKRLRESPLLVAVALSAAVVATVYFGAKLVSEKLLGPPKPSPEPA